MRQYDGLEKYVEGFRDGSASLISKDMVIEGSITTEAKTTLVVAGQIRGSVKTEGDLVIVDGGTVQGGAKCNRLLVAGSLSAGEDKAAEVSCAILHVARSGRIDGEDMSVSYGLVRMDPGAQIRARLVPSGQSVDASLLENFGPAPALEVAPALRSIAEHEPGDGAPRSVTPLGRPETSSALSRTEAYAQSSGMGVVAGQRPAVGSAA